MGTLQEILNVKDSNLQFFNENLSNNSFSWNIMIKNPS